MARPLTIGLGIALLASLAANAYLLIAAVDTAHGWSDAQATVRHMADERLALRAMALRLANNETPRQAFENAAREVDADASVDEDESWLVSGPLMAKFEGETLTELCWSVLVSNGGVCSIQYVEQRSPPLGSP